MAIIVILLIVLLMRLIFDSEMKAVAYAALFIAILGYMSAFQLMAQKQMEEQGNNTTTQHPEGTPSLFEHNEDQSEEKEENKKELLTLFDTHKEIDNDMVQKHLNVSHATANRYLTELEEEGKLTASGDAGKHVTYRRNT